MLVGVCGRNEVRWPQADIEAIKKFDLVKFMSDTDPAIIQKVVSMGKEVIVRLYHPSFNTGGHLSASEFIAHARQVITRLGDSCLFYQIHNEPNHHHRIEGFGSTNQDAAKFDNWFLEVCGALQKEFPDKKFGFPGLALPKFLHRTEAWLDLCRKSIAMADWLGCHCYWQTINGNSKMYDRDFGAIFQVYHERYPEKDIFILECGNSNTQGNIPLAEADQAREYVEWTKFVSLYNYVKGICFFILSSPDPYWRGFELINRQVVNELGNLKLKKSKLAKSGQTVYTNQDIINAFYFAANALGYRDKWAIIKKTPLNLASLAGDNRRLPYIGVSVDKLLNLLSYRENVALSKQLGIETPDNSNWIVSFEKKHHIEPKLLKAVLTIESNQSSFIDGRMVIRFEPHIFQRLLGKNKVFFNHWSLGKPAHSGRQHWFREKLADQWSRFHGNQDAEWNVFEFAKTIDNKKALLSTSYGLAQIMGFNHRACGFKTVVEMFDSFQESEENQLEGFANFIVSKPNLLNAMRQKDFFTIATIYNGAGNAAYYAGLIKSVYES